MYTFEILTKPPLRKRFILAHIIQHINSHVKTFALVIYVM